MGFHEGDVRNTFNCSKSIHWQKPTWVVLYDMFWHLWASWIDTPWVQVYMSIVVVSLIVAAPIHHSTLAWRSCIQSAGFIAIVASSCSYQKSWNFMWNWWFERFRRWSHASWYSLCLIPTVQLLNAYCKWSKAGHGQKATIVAVFTLLCFTHILVLCTTLGPLVLVCSCDFLQQWGLDHVPCKIV